MKKILILESGKAISTMINNLIKNKSHEMEMIISRNNGSKRIPNEIPDLVIADLTSIKKEKVELLMQLKNNPVISLVPFLFFTSKNGKLNEEVNSTCNFYQIKPFTEQELFVSIKKIFNQVNNLSPW
ncbi:MAG TPA: hypothetical protein VLN45_03180 [Ignavibacteriaceae bacterium]|nr:hypothetical protein [Ignavibacteriaceae bacterium]